MARLPRLVIPDQPHLLIQRGHNRRPVFVDDDDYRRFHEAMQAASRDAGAAIHAYVLLPDRIQLLASPTSTDALGSLMQRIGRRYVASFNERHQRSGTLWDGRFRATVIEPERFLLDSQRHLEQGPVREQLVLQPYDWPWSSAAHHVGLRRDPVITEHSMYWRLGNTPFEREAAYRAMVDVVVPSATAAAIEAACDKGWALGSEAFLAQLSRATDRPLQPRPRGRPRTKS